MGVLEMLTRLDKIEDVLLAQIRELRTIRAEIQKQANDGNLEPLMDAKQVANIFGVEFGHIHAQARRRNLPSVMVGKYRKFSPSQLKKWLDRKNEA